MTRRTKRLKRNTNTRTYPIYIVSSPDLSDDESIIEIKPIKRRRKNQTRVSPRGQIRTYVVKQPHMKPERLQKSANIQTEAIASLSPITDTNNEQLSKTKSNVNKTQHRCLRIFTIILSIFLLIISILLLAFSLNLLLNPNMEKIRTVAIVYSNATPSSGFSGKGPTDTLLVTAIIGITIGAFMLIIFIMTLIVVICIKFRYYGCFFFIGPVLLFLLFIILIGFAIFIMITGDTELQRLATSTQTTVYTYYNSSYTSLVRDGWDFVQYYFSCCGIKSNNTDWIVAPSTGWSYNTQLPRSCCGYDKSDIGHPGRIFVGENVPALTGFCYYGDIGQPTCYDSIKTNLLITVLIFLIGTALIVLILGILVIILIVFYRTIHQTTKKIVKK